MRIAPFASAVTWLTLSAGILCADVPELEPAVELKDGAQSLHVLMYSTPTAVDWNNDGAKDLLVGQIMYGHIWLYLNQGTDLNPLFDGGALIESNGAPISVTSG